MDNFWMQLKTWITFLLLKVFLLRRYYVLQSVPFSVSLSMPTVMVCYGGCTFYTRYSCHTRGQNKRDGPYNMKHVYLKCWRHILEIAILNLFQVTNSNKSGFHGVLQFHHLHYEGGLWYKLQCPTSKPSHSTYIGLPKSDVGYSILLPNHHIPPLISVCQILQLHHHHYSLYIKGQGVPLIKHTVKTMRSVCKASHTCQFTLNELAATAHWTWGSWDLQNRSWQLPFASVTALSWPNKLQHASHDFRTLF